MNIHKINKPIILFLSLCMSIPFSIISSSIVGAPLVSIFFISTVIFILLISNLLLIKQRKIRIIYLIINILGLILLIYNARYKTLPIAGVDWYNFDYFAKTAIANSTDLTTLYNNSIDLFSFLISIIYKIFGSNIEQIYFYVFSFSLITFRYIYKTVLMISKKENSAIWAAIAISAWPINLILSSSILRGIPIQALVIISFYNLIKYIYNNKSINLFGALLSIIGASLMHSGIVGILIVYIYIILQNKLYKDYKIIRFSAIIIACLFIALLSLTPIWSDVTKRFTSIGGVNDIVSSLDQQNEYLIANTQYISSVPQNLTEIIMSAPYRLFMFTFSPLIWQVYDVQTLLAFIIDGIPQLIIMYILYSSLKSYKTMASKDRIIIVTIIFSILITYTIFSFGTNNYGAAMRHRTDMLPLLIVFIFSYNNYTKKLLKI